MLRLDQRPVLADGRRRIEAQKWCGQRPASDRHLRAGSRARRHLRRAFILGRQEAAALASQGGAQPPRHGHARRDLAVRDVQRS